MLDLDGIGRACKYTLDALWLLTSEQINVFLFIGFAGHYGYPLLDDLIPKNAIYGKLNPPASHLTTSKDSTGCNLVMSASR